MDAGATTLSNPVNSGDDLTGLEIALLLGEDATAVLLDIHARLSCTGLTVAEVGTAIPVLELDAILKIGTGRTAGLQQYFHGISPCFSFFIIAQGRIMCKILVFHHRNSRYKRKTRLIQMNP